MIRIGWHIAAASLTYVLASQLGLYAAVGESLVSAVWPATGVAMALLWIGGLRLWPAIVLGDLLSSVMGGWSLGLASASAIGNTLDAVLGVLLLRRFGFSGRFFSIAEVPRLAASPMLACVTSATLGGIAMVLAGQTSWSDFGALWLTWWGSAVTGALIVFPFLITAARFDEWALSRAKLIELVVFVAVSMAGFTLIMLFATPGEHGQELSFFILVVALLVWPALRLNLCWATLTVLMLVAAVITATRAGVGPFAFDALERSLLLLQAFVGTVSLVTLIVFTALKERDQAVEAMRLGKEAAEDAARAKSAFLAAMSHELRTPLNAILGFSEVLSRKDLAPNFLYDSHKVAEYGGYIHKAGASLLSLINDLLDLSKIDACKFEVTEEDVPIDRVVDECLTAIRHYPSGKFLVLSYEAGMENGVLRSDYRRFEQIMLNLLSNAVKYTLPGGSVTIRTEKAGGRFLVTVKDTGIGMTTEQIAKALIPFAQIDNPMTRKNEGTGLGLPLTDQLTRQLGGVLRFESQPGHGTTVTVEFPAEKLKAPMAGDGADVTLDATACKKTA